MSTMAFAIGSQDSASRTRSPRRSGVPSRSSVMSLRIESTSK
jgi:hypothetical protein